MTCNYLLIVKTWIYINEKENEFIVFICKNVSKKAFHFQKASFKVSMLIPIAKINPANVLIWAWFAKINLVKHNFFTFDSQK